LQRALAADSTNPFANYIAAKVSFARGDCAAARPFSERALTNGNFYGTLTAATISEGALCSGNLAQDLDAEARITSLVEAIPEPNSLLRVYLIFATAALDRPDLSRRLLAAPMSDDPQGSLVDISAALGEGLADPAAFAAHRDRLLRVVDGFYWGASARTQMIDKLAAVAAYRD
jgi:hypothetical protein